jgi:hypothetical protein
MFKEGDRVRNVAANVVGTVVEVDGGTVYLEQYNGVEVEFPAAVLVLEAAFQAKHDRSTATSSAAAAADPAYDRVVAQLYPAMLELGQQYYAAIKRTPGVVPTPWDKLTALQKLNAVSEATDVPVKSWIEATRSGATPQIGPLQLSILAARGRKG